MTSDSLDRLRRHLKTLQTDDEIVSYLHRFAWRHRLGGSELEAAAVEIDGVLKLENELADTVFRVLGDQGAELLRRAKKELAP
jgi:hypothetical protein